MVLLMKSEKKALKPISKRNESDSPKMARAITASRVSPPMVAGPGGYCSHGRDTPVSLLNWITVSGKFENAAFHGSTTKKQLE